jgi:hypothetical protein
MLSPADRHYLRHFFRHCFRHCARTRSLLPYLLRPPLFPLSVLVILHPPLCHRHPRVQACHRRNEASHFADLVLHLSFAFPPSRPVSFKDRSLRRNIHCLELCGNRLERSSIFVSQTTLPSKIDLVALKDKPWCTGCTGYVLSKDTAIERRRRLSKKTKHITCLVIPDQFCPRITQKPGWRPRGDSHGRVENLMDTLGCFQAIRGGMSIPRTVDLSAGPNEYCK